MKFQKLIGTLLVATVLVSTFAVSASATETTPEYVDSYMVGKSITYDELSPGAMGPTTRNNHQDRYIYISSYQNSGGTPYCSPTFEDKTDDSSVYVMNTYSSGGSLDAWVLRKKSINAKIEMDRKYGGGYNIPYNGPSNKVRTARGDYNYLYNWVYEDGYPLAGLGYIMNTEGVYYEIAWSPDSI